MEAFLNEAEILKTLSTQSCPYVVHLVGLQLEHAPPMIAMELVPCGNLLDILKSSSLAVSYSIRYQWILTRNSLTGLLTVFTHCVVDFVNTNYIVLLILFMQSPLCCRFCLCKLYCVVDFVYANCTVLSILFTRMKESLILT